ALALRPLIAAGKLPSDVLKRQIAAISVGLVGGEPLLDLAYEQDVAAEVDLNVVMTAGGQLVDVQGTGEKSVFSRAQLDELLTLAERGIQQLVRLQNQALNGR
ncbi:MAG: ribonuclease PH, partial [Chloroflexota bacterium]